MVKIIFLLKRKPGLTPAEFRQHYEEVHAPLVLNLSPNIRRYVRNYITTNVIPTEAEESDFDCISEIWLDDNVEGIPTMIDTAAERGDHIQQAIGHSGKVFLDQTKVIRLIVEEVESEIG